MRLNVEHPRPKITGKQTCAACPEEEFSPTPDSAAAPPPSPAPTPAPEAARSPADDLGATLERLADLRDKGLITPEEYEAKKRDLLERM